MRGGVGGGAWSGVSQRFCAFFVTDFFSGGGFTERSVVNTWEERGGRERGKIGEGREERRGEWVGGLTEREGEKVKVLVEGGE